MFVLIRINGCYVVRTKKRIKERKSNKYYIIAAHSKYDVFLIRENCEYFVITLSFVNSFFFLLYTYIVIHYKQLYHYIFINRFIKYVLFNLQKIDLS